MVPAMRRPERNLLWIFSAFLLIAWIMYFTHGGWFAAVGPVPGSAPAGDSHATGTAQTRRGESATVALGSAGQRMTVYITGAVKRPGIYHLPLDARVVAAIHAAGGATSAADLAAINLAAILEDGTQIVVPENIQAHAGSSGKAAAPQSIGAAESGAGTIPIPVSARSRHRIKNKLQPGERININHSDLLMLEELPGIGAKKAQAILSYRVTHGMFSSLVQLRLVHGIGPTLLEKLSAYVTL